MTKTYKKWDGNDVSIKIIQMTLRSHKTLFRLRSDGIPISQVSLYACDLSMSFLDGARSICRGKFDPATRSDAMIIDL